MSELQRQLLSAAAGVGTFLYLFLSLLYIWPVALGVAVVVLLAVGLLVDAKPPPGLEWLTGARMTKADFDALIKNIEEKETKLRETATLAIPDDVKRSVLTMAGDLRSVIDFCKQDSAAVRPIRAFVGTYLADIVDALKRYTLLVSVGGEAQQDKLDEIKTLIIKGFEPQVRRLQMACFEHDLESLKTNVVVSASVMDTQTKMRGM